MHRISMNIVLVSMLILSHGAGVSPAAPIGYVEDFALAADRTTALEQLIPGTELYYFYHCLHFQNTGRLDKVEEMLGPWIKRHKHTALVREIRNRQALLKYDRDPKGSLEFIRRRMGLRFNHQRERLDRKP